MLQQARPNIVQTISEYGKRLFRFIRGRVNTDEDAEDILQDVWYQFSALAETEVISEVNAWLHRVARNKIIDKYRKKKDVLLDDFTFDNEDGELGYKDILLADDSNPETEYLRSFSGSS